MSLKPVALLLGCVSSAIPMAYAGHAAAQPSSLMSQFEAAGGDTPFNLNAPIQDKSSTAGFARLDALPSAQMAQPVARTVPVPPSNVDESALRFYASQNDSARVAMEIKRIKAMHPSWEPPTDLFNVTSDPAVEQKLWDLFGEGRYDEVRLAVDNIRRVDPTWRPSGKLVQEFDRAQVRGQLIAASDAKDAAGVLAVAEANPGMLVCADVDALWRVAEALVQTSQEDRAQELYKYILTRCPDPAERLATVQKAMELLPAAAVKTLMATARYRTDGSKTYEIVQLDLLRRQIGAVAADATAPQVPAAELKSFEAQVKQKKLANDADLLGWYHYSLKAWPVAAEWFKQGMDWTKQPKSAEGYALALRQQGQLTEAENVAYEWRNSSPLIAKLYIEILATALTQPNPAPVEEARLARLQEVVQATKSANGGQALGWYHYNRNEFPKSRQWFAASVEWEAKETSVLGLALASHRSNDRASFQKTVADYGKQYPSIAALQSYQAPAKDGRRSGSGNRGGGGSSVANQLASTAVEQFKNGQYKEALATLEKRSTVAKEDHGLGVLRGWAHYQLNQYDKARDKFAELDKKQSTRDTQYGLYYSGAKLDPTHKGD
jgi:tetratricopeptide (TPR) repeat protein